MAERTGIVYGLPEAEYHAPKDELSSTGAKTLLKNAARFKWEVLDGNRVWSEGFDLGTAVHALVLEDAERYVTYPEEHLTPSGNTSTKADTVAWAKQQHDAGNVLLTPNQVKQMRGMAESVKNHPEAMALFGRPGHSEASVFDHVRGVKRRGRFDYLPDDGGLVVDLKTTVDASPEGFERSIAKWRYDIQRAHYLSILESITGERRDMLFVAVEKEPPYYVGVHRISEQWAEIGEKRALEAVDKYRRCMETGIWPAYEGISTLNPPMYLIYEDEELEQEEIQI